jgi:hypothetical protein
MEENLTTNDSEQQQAPHLRVGAVSKRFLFLDDFREPYHCSKYMRTGKCI